MSETLAGKHARFGDDPDRRGSSAPDPTGDPLGDPLTAPLRGPAGSAEPGAEDDTRTTEALQPPLAVPTPGSATQLQVTCPECGTVAMVAPNRRESSDFCARCDFPLFWTPTTIVLASPTMSEESLRRLPGTAGQAVVASVPCPHCAEGNPITAVVCVRCGRSMRPVEPEPAPVVVTPPPPPPPAPEPERTPLWVWLLGGLTLLVLIALVVYFITTR